MSPDSKFGVIFIVLLNMVMTVALSAQRYPFRVYNVKEGLTQSQVQTVLQDNYGYLWIGTRDGLANFDGKQFVNFGRKDGLVGNYILSSLLDAHGNIWLTHRTRGEAGKLSGPARTGPATIGGAFEYPQPSSHTGFIS